MPLLRSFTIPRANSMVWQRDLPCYSSRSLQQAFQHFRPHVESAKRKHRYQFDVCWLGRFASHDSRSTRPLDHSPIDSRGPPRRGCDVVSEPQPMESQWQCRCDRLEPTLVRGWRVGDQPGTGATSMATWTSVVVRHRCNRRRDGNDVPGSQFRHFPSGADHREKRSISGDPPPNLLFRTCHDFRMLRCLRQPNALGDFHAGRRFRCRPNYCRRKSPNSVCPIR